MKPSPALFIVKPGSAGSVNKEQNNAKSNIDWGGSS